MKKIKIFLAALSLIVAIPTAAQNNNDNGDDVIDLPEGMQVNTDSMIAAWNASKYFQLDTTSQLADINPYFEKSVYRDRLKRIPCVMEMTYNDIVQKYIDQYTGRLRHSVSYILGASNFYVPIFEDALTYYQIPLELKNLPVIESAFNPRARSRVGAMGLWQFMPATGKRYGLTINSLVDERCDPIKASYAAAKYLKDLYNIFGDWTLVIAAYNCGPNNISKAIHRSGGERDFWKIYPYLPRETRGYVPAFIAANYVINYYGDHNILPMHANIPANTDTLLLNRDVQMEQIARICGIDIQELKVLNPQYLTNLIPGYRMNCTLRLPQKQLLNFIDLQDSIYTASNSENTFAQNINSEINSNNGESTQTNSFISNNRYRSSTSSRNSSRRTRRTSRRSRRERTKSVTIKEGETLSELAEKHGTTVAKLRKLNHISGSSIRSGKKIRVK